TEDGTTGRYIVDHYGTPGTYCIYVNGKSTGKTITINAAGTGSNTIDFISTPVVNNPTYDETVQTCVAADADYNITGTNTGTDAGSYNVTVSLKDSDKLWWCTACTEYTNDNIDTTWKINKRQISIAANDQTKDYDGTSAVAQGSAYVTVGGAGIVTGQTLTDTIININNVTSVGNYPDTLKVTNVTITTLRSGVTTDVTANYEITYAFGDLTINKSNNNSWYWEITAGGDTIKVDCIEVVQEDICYNVDYTPYMRECTSDTAVAANPRFGTVDTLYYSTSAPSVAIAKPTTPGSYIVKMIVSETANYYEISADTTYTVYEYAAAGSIAVQDTVCKNTEFTISNVTEASGGNNGSYLWLTKTVTAGGWPATWTVVTDSVRKSLVVSKIDTTSVYARVWKNDCGNYTTAIDTIVVPSYYRVYYLANGEAGANGIVTGSVTDNTLYCSYNTEVTVKANSSPGFVRVGYNFVEWNTQSNGLGTGYSPNAKFEMPEKDVNLYAIWEPKKVNVKVITLKQKPNGTYSKTDGRYYSTTNKSFFTNDSLTIGYNTTDSIIWSNPVGYTYSASSDKFFSTFDKTADTTITKVLVLGNGTTVVYMYGTAITYDIIYARNYNGTNINNGDQTVTYTEHHVYGDTIVFAGHLTDTTNYSHGDGPFNAYYSIPSDGINNYEFVGWYPKSTSSIGYKSTGWTGDTTQIHHIGKALSERDFAYSYSYTTLQFIKLLRNANILSSSENITNGSTYYLYAEWTSNPVYYVNYHQENVDGTHSRVYDITETAAGGSDIRFADTSDITVKKHLEDGYTFDTTMHLNGYYYDSDKTVVLDTVATMPVAQVTGKNTWYFAVSAGTIQSGDSVVLSVDMSKVYVYRSGSLSATLNASKTKLSNADTLYIDRTSVNSLKVTSNLAAGNYCFRSDYLHINIYYRLNRFVAGYWPNGPYNVDASQTINGEVVNMKNGSLFELRSDPMASSTIGRIGNIESGSKFAMYYPHHDTTSTTVYDFTALKQIKPTDVLRFVIDVSLGKAIFVIHEAVTNVDVTVSNVNPAGATLLSFTYGTTCCLSSGITIGTLCSFVYSGKYYSFTTTVDLSASDNIVMYYDGGYKVHQNQTYKLTADAHEPSTFIYSDMYREGYHFADWNVNSSGTPGDAGSIGYSYSDGHYTITTDAIEAALIATGKLEAGKHIPDGDEVKIYALWAPNTDVPYVVYNLMQKLDGSYTYTDTTCILGKYKGTADDTLWIGTGRNIEPNASIDVLQFAYYSAKDGNITQYVKGDTIALSTPQAGDAGVVDSTTVLPNSKRAVYMFYERQRYDVTYVVEGSTYTTETDVMYADTLTEPVEPTRGGYSFNGWFTAAVGGSEWTFSGVSANTMPANDLNLYAQWTAGTATVKLYSDANSWTAKMVAIASTCESSLPATNVALTETPANSGDYSVTAQAAGTYYIYVAGYCTQQQITIDAYGNGSKTLRFITPPAPTPQVYTGEELTGVVGNSYYESTDADNTNSQAGSYISTVDLKTAPSGETWLWNKIDTNGKYETGSIDINWEITQRHLEITAASQTWIYDGQEHYYHDLSLTNGTTLGKNDYIHDTTFASTIKYVGSTSNIVSEFHIYNSIGDKDVTANYDLDTIAGTLTVNKANIAIEITAGGNTWCYNPDTTYKYPVYSITSGSLISGDGITSVSYVGSIKNIGYTSNKASSAVVKNNGTDVTLNYDFTYVDGTLTVVADPQVSATKSPKEAVICSGTVITLIDTILTGGTGCTTSDIQYSYSSNGTDWTDKGNVIPEITVTDAGLTWYIRMIVSCSGEGCDADTAVYSWTVIPTTDVTITGIIPDHDTIVRSGSILNLSANATSQHGNTLQYQWQQSSDNVNYSDITGATNDTYTTPSMTDTTYYRCNVSVSSDAGICNNTTQTSGVISVIVYDGTPCVGCDPGNPDPFDPNSGVSCESIGNQYKQPDAGTTTYTHNGTDWNVTANDLVPITSIVYTLSGVTTSTGTSLNGVTFNYGTTTVTWTVTNAAGSTSSCSFTVRVYDGTPCIGCNPDDPDDPFNPETGISCESIGRQYRQPDAGTTTYTHNGTDWNITANDSIPITSIIYELSGVTTGTGTSLNGVTFNYGTTTVTWTVTNAAGSTSSCSFTVRVYDGTP
ncbi:MAG: InlB B-repeat-containing protein, partial [Bacteroidales bacterium]|nr:InlB B-repeat-containing protein [Bacteroidales bacterium]